MNLKNRLILLILSFSILFPSETYTRSLSKRQKQAIALAAKKLKAKRSKKKKQKNKKTKKKTSSKSKNKKKNNIKAKSKKKTTKKIVKQKSKAISPKPIVITSAPIVPVIPVAPVVPVMPAPIVPVTPAAPIVPVGPVAPMPVAPVVVPAQIHIPIEPAQNQARNIQNPRTRQQEIINRAFVRMLEQDNVERESRQRAEQEAADRRFAEQLQRELNAEDINEPVEPAQETIECLICRDEKNNIISLPVCNHEFCADCIKEHANIAAREITLDNFKCAQCQRQITEQEFSGMADCRDQYNSFIERRRNRDNNGINRPNVVTQQDADTLSRVTKKCPNCNVRIQRSEGCNHMTCEQCRHEFCLICLNNWVRGTYHSVIGCQVYDCRADIERFTPAYPTDTRENRIQEDLIICRACNQEIYLTNNNHIEARCGHLYHRNCYNNHDINSMQSGRNTNCHTCNQALVRREFNNRRYW